MASDDPFRLKRPHAQLDWREEGPIAREADDIYFSVHNGLEEARTVFLAGAGFPERFDKTLTVVGELGFGTGLNFLALWEAFRRAAAPSARLHFVSVEGFPLRRCDAERALAAFPEIAALSEPLCQVWPSSHKGPHRRVFEAGRVTLTVIHDDVGHALAQQNFLADAWFLDGFAPAKNPDMWGTGLLCEIARLSKPGAHVGTFTVAGHVRRGLAEAGFAVAKKPGFGRKRERLEAIHDGTPAHVEETPFPPARATPGKLAVIGGGIAAASLVHALNTRGRDVEVFAQGGWAAGASGAPLGLLTPRLEAADRPHSRALISAFDYARTLYLDAGLLSPVGGLRLAKDEAGRARLKALAEHLDEGFVWREGKQDSEEAGLWMERAGTFDPRQIVEKLGAPARLHDVRIETLQREGDGWLLLGPEGHGFGPFAGVILAGGHQLGDLSGVSIEARAGQVAIFRSSDRVPAPRAWGGYCAQLTGEQVLVGATHVKGEDWGESEAAEAALRAELTGSPLTSPPRLDACLSAWGGVRAAVADRLPLLGPLPETNYDDRWRAVARGGVKRPSEAARSDRAGLFVLGAFGARGFAHAPLLAEALVSGLCDEPIGLESSAIEAFHPARFQWRRLKRG